MAVTEASAANPDLGSSQPDSSASPSPHGEEETLGGLATDYGKQLAGYVELFQLQSQLFFLSLLKMLLLGLAMLMLGLSAWLLLVAAAIEQLAAAGLALPLAIILGALATMVAAWSCWRAVIRNMRRMRLSLSPKEQNHV